MIKLLKKDKPKEVEELKNLMAEYSVVGILDMHAMPGRQLQKIRDNMRGKAVIRGSKISLMRKAFESNDNFKKLEEKITGEPALLLSNVSPFRLFRMIKDNRSPASAKPGDVAPNDIIIQKGATNIPPGPSISTLQKIGLKTSVQGGKIAIMADKVAVKSGETITADAASVFSLLKLEPMEIGLNVIAVYEDNVIYTKDVLDIDVSSYLEEISRCASAAINLSVEIGYPTKQSIEIMLQKAYNEAKSLSVETNFPEKEFIGSLLAKAAMQSKALNIE